MEQTAEAQIKLKIWGTRGSFPITAPEFSEYGGNTSCVSVEKGGCIVIFDAGSGIEALGRAIRPGAYKRIDLFISHMHMDHVMGLFGFRPLFYSGQEIHIYGGRQETGSFSEELNRFFGPPLWPVKLKLLPCSLTVHEISAGSSTQLPGEWTVKAEAGCHPGGSLLYRLETPGRSVVYGLDCEPTETNMEKLAAFAKHADLLLLDGAYTPEEYPLRQGWGHGTWKQWSRFREQAGAERALMLHHSWDYNDAFLREQENRLTELDPRCGFAKEGMEVEL